MLLHTNLFGGPTKIPSLEIFNTKFFWNPKFSLYLKILTQKLINDLQIVWIKILLEVHNEFLDQNIFRTKIILDWKRFYQTVDQMFFMGIKLFWT